MEKNSTYIDKNYHMKWLKSSPFNLEDFQFSFFHPTIKPEFPKEAAEKKKKEEKSQVMISIFMCTKYKSIIDILFLSEILLFVEDKAKRI